MLINHHQQVFAGQVNKYIFLKICAIRELTSQKGGELMSWSSSMSAAIQLSSKCLAWSFFIYKLLSKEALIQTTIMRGPLKEGTRWGSSTLKYHFWHKEKRVHPIIHS